MKKKLQNPVKENDKVDLKSLIHENSLFFDKLIELIPPRFYLPVDDKDKKWFQGLSKDEKALAKKQSIENIKKARRDRLDPAKASATTLDLLMKNLEKEKENDEDEDEMEINPMKISLEGKDSATYEELKERLHRKIEELKGGRNNGNSGRAKKRNERKEFLQKKRKRETVSEEKKAASNSSAEKLESDAAEAAKELKFSHVKLGTEEERAKKMKKHSKMKELEKAKELEEAKNDPEKGEIVSKKHSWKAATERAAGVKVHDDPKLIKLSLKKEKKRRQKNAEKWKERIETQQKMKAEKQQTRSQNIADRIQQKKMRRIAKREKKLMRPGFEGRKDGYINQPSTAGTGS